MAAKSTPLPVSSSSSELSDLHKSRIPVICEKCGGCGKLDDKEHKPWSRFQRARNPEVAAGIVQPENCPDCQGHGTVQPKSDSTQES